MIRTIQEFFKITATLVIGSLILVNCEPDADQLGSQFFQDGAQGTEKSYPIIAYNVYHGTPGILNTDTIRTDAARLQSATLGAFAEPQFGLQKSAYVSQVRLSTYTPDFGTNAVLDSAVLVLKPLYVADSVTTVTNEDYIFPEGAVPAKKVINTYPILKYGKTKIAGKTLLNFKIHEVTDFLGSNINKIFSNKIVNTGAEIGSKTFNGNILSVQVTKDSDNSVLFESAAAIRIPLDSTYFTNKILTKGTTPELADAASFIRYFKGIKISVDENDGYLFNFDPTTTELVLYYKNDKVEGTTTTRASVVYNMNLGSLNTYFNQFSFDRAGTPSASIISANQTTGDAKLFAQGMGGSGIGLRVPAADVAAIRALYDNDKIGIVSAKIRLYTDPTWSSNYNKPSLFVVRQRNLTPAVGEKEYLEDFLTDMSTLYGSSNYRLVKAYDLEKSPAYYDIGITQTFKNIIEKLEPNYDFVIDVGTYTTDTGGNILGALYSDLGSQNFNTRSFTPNRAVLIGTDPSNEKSAKLILTYGQKQ